MNLRRDVDALMAILKGFRREFWSVGIFSLVINLLMLTPTLYMLQVYDRVLVSQSGLTLLALSLIALFCFAVIGFAELVRSRLLVRAGLRFDALVNTRVFRAGFDAALDQTGRNPREAFDDLLNLRQFLTGNGIFAFFDLPWMPVYIAVVALLHPWLGGVTLIFALLLGLIAWYGHHRTEGFHALALEAGQQTSSFAQSRLRNAEVIQAMGMLPALLQRWLNLNRRQLAVQEAMGDRIQRQQSLIRFVQSFMQALTLAAGAVFVIRGELSPAAMIAVNVLMGRALAPMQQLAATWRAFMAAKLSYDRLNDLLISYPESAGLPLSETPRGAMRCEALQAFAPGRQTPILQGIDLDVSPGELIVILGPSGSGKSTLARCLMGIWPRTAGRVLLDGASLAELDRAALGPYLGYLPQDIELLEGTIAENIARFGPLDSEKVIAAARAADIHEMILRFPQGYDTPVGVGGAKLSAGQRQRIALARALYGEPAVLVLDEPNANLDDAGEMALQRAVLEQRAQGRTVIVVSHRGGIVSLADRLLVLVEGRIHLLGPPAIVLAKLTKPSTQTEAAPPSSTSLSQ